MRHRKEGRKFHRKTGQRRSFVRTLMLAFFKSGKIKTTEARAKEIKPLVEKAITLAKKQDLASRRLLLSRLHDKKIVQKLCDELAKKYAERRGGYTRITKLAITRKRDATRMVSLELI
jgi:large subunit ribosomal protein L17